MATVTVSKIKQNAKEYTRYTMQLPKEVMDRLMAKSGDKLEFIGENSGILTFQFTRSK